jgi:4-aminobutyrate aminotransferase
MRHCLEEGLVLIECGGDKNVIRLAPPLTITRQELEQGLDLLEEAVAKTA